MVGERGFAVSAGERNDRVARAFLADPAST